MRLVVFGATGRTGRAVVHAATGRGHTVTAAARSASTHTWPPGVIAASADITDPNDVHDVLRDAEAAVVAVGIGATRAPTTTYSAGTANVLAALADHESARVSLVSAVPAAPAALLPLGQRLAAPLLSLFFGSTYADMRRMEQLLSTSPLNWVCLRPPRLIGRPSRGGYRLGATPTGSAITYADLASALLDVLDDSSTFRRKLFVAS